MKRAGRRGAPAIEGVLINYYDLLAVSRQATEDEIRGRFRILAREAHPDRQRDAEKKRQAEERFQILTEALNVLTNPARRKLHDTELDKHKPAVSDAQSISRAYLARGVKAYKEGLFPQALEEFDLAVKHWDKDAKAFHFLALACQRVVGQVRRGIEAVENAIRLDPNNPTYRKDAGRLYVMAGLNAKAERHLSEALKWFPEDAETLTLLHKARGGESQRPTSGGFGRKG
ncbi:MAG TPA: DnaJ domain-containing protein [Thermoanaerobaculia bacterium]|nr:DnaJ domain-containing protein [Thermoanaerobaculia bacterium]